VKHAPGKTFKNLYRDFFRERIGQQARNETAGYVVMRVLERLSKEDLEQAVEAILPEIPSLVDRSRTAIIKTMVERCAARKADTQALADSLRKAYGDNGDSRLLKVLRWDAGSSGGSDEKTRQAPKEDMAQLHGSLLAQAMLAVPGPLSDLIFDDLLALAPETLLAMTETPVTSHVLQASLQLPTSTPAFRRKMMNQLFGHLARLAVHPAGSHVVDALWTASHGLGNYKERAAHELSAHEAELRESYVGRAVWRNWMLDLYSRRKTDWLAKAKGASFPYSSPIAAPAQSGSAIVEQVHEKSGITLAREKFAASRAKAGRGGGGSRTPGKATGANAVSNAAAA
jgi:nucleolar protein 9